MKKTYNTDGKNMQSCSYQEICGGCVFRNLTEEKYQQTKLQKVQNILKGLDNQEYKFCAPIFIQDGQRRRASLAFSFKKGNLKLGFNQEQSAELVDINHCCLLTEKLNQIIPSIRQVLSELCAVKTPQYKKNKIIGYKNVTRGDVWLTQADNGIDVVLEFDDEINLEYRMIISEFALNNASVIRVSHRKNDMSMAETLVEKIKPYIKIADYEVYIPAGTFLQASKEAENKMIALVEKYIGNTNGKIADLFCGVGTFSYPLSKNPNNKIYSLDSSKSLLEGFQTSVNKNMIPNIQIQAKNLFKYPLDEKELSGFDAIVFDPPRAGAEEQVKKIVQIKEGAPKKIVAISCNPHSFIKDANILINGGYKLKEITMVDQFVYSAHTELVAYFEK